MAARLGARGIHVDRRRRRAGRVSDASRARKGSSPALESSHAIAHVCRLAPEMGRDEVLLVNLSGRGDKDVLSVQKVLDAAAAAEAAVR